MALSGSVSTSSYDGRYVKLSWTATQNIANNTSTISWTLKGAGSASCSWYKAGGFQVYIDGNEELNKSTDYRITLYNGTSVASGSITLKHGSDGKKTFSISVKAGIYTYARNCSGSKSFTLDTIPRAATISSAPNFNDEENPKITYSNLAGSSATTLQACIANSNGSTVYCAYRDISKSGSSYTFTLTDAERTTLRNACKSAKSMTVRFYVKTVIGGNTYTKYLEKTLTIANANPTVSVTVSDADTAMTALTGSADKLVKYYSDAQYSISASGVKGASISSYKIECGTKSASTASGTLSNVESGTFKITVTDSRGNITTKTVTKTIANYIKLTNNLSFDTPTVDGSVNIKWNGNYFNGSFGSVANTCTVQYRYKEEGGSYGSWITATATKSGNTYSVSTKVTGLDYKKTYVFQSRVTDKITYKDSETVTVTFQPIFDWGANSFDFNVPMKVNVDNAIIFRTGADTTSGFLQSLPTYKRTYAQSPNMYVTDMGTFGRGTSSSMRYKEDIQDIVNEELNPRKILEIPVRQYKYNKDNIPLDREIDDIYIGLIAEEVEAAYPAAAEYNEDGTIEMWNIKVLFPALLKVVQEQQKEIDSLKAKMEG